jgi:hypothetical protein
MLSCSTLLAGAAFAGPELEFGHFPGLRRRSG